MVIMFLYHMKSLIVDDLWGFYCSAPPTTMLKMVIPVTTTQATVLVEYVRPLRNSVRISGEKVCILFSHT